MVGCQTFRRSFRRQICLTTFVRVNWKEAKCRSQMLRKMMTNGVASQLDLLQNLVIEISLPRFCHLPFFSVCCQFAVHVRCVVPETRHHFWDQLVDPDFSRQSTGSDSVLVFSIDGR